MDTFPSVPLESKIDAIAKALRKFYKTEYEEPYPLKHVRKSVEFMLAMRGESVLEDNGEVLMMRGRSEFDEMRGLLQEPRRRELGLQAVEELDGVQLPLYVEEPNKFNGYVVFAPERFQAMIVHLAFRSKKLAMTRLNKLLFYADFSFFALIGRGLSGSEYIKLTHGPVAPPYANTIRDLRDKRQIRTDEFGSPERKGKRIRPKKSYDPSDSVLNSQERKILDWVVETYDSLSTPELIAMSHREDAYWDTRWLQPIDYNLAKHLELKPPKDLLDN